MPKKSALPGWAVLLGELSREGEREERDKEKKKKEPRRAAGLAGNTSIDRGDKCDTK